MDKPSAESNGQLEFYLAPEGSVERAGPPRILKQANMVVERPGKSTINLEVSVNEKGELTFHFSYPFPYDATREEIADILQAAREHIDPSLVTPEGIRVRGLITSFRKRAKRSMVRIEYWPNGEFVPGGKKY